MGRILTSRMAEKVVARRTGSEVKLIDAGNGNGYIYDPVLKTRSAIQPIQAFLKFGYWEAPEGSLKSHGGKGSGGHGHVGRPGKVGGSAKTRAQMTKEERKADVEKTTKQKWARVAAFAKDRPKIMKQIEKDFGTSDEAKVLSLIDKTGFRVGGSRKRGEKEVFGASTIMAKHVKVTGDSIEFNFLGKSAVQQGHTLKDKGLADVIGSRSKSKGKIFKTSDNQVRAYLKEVSGKDYLVKDFRTHVATSRASALTSKMPVFKTKKEYNKAKNDICTAVSRILGNSPAMAKSSYINPKVWDGLRLEP